MLCCSCSCVISAITPAPTIPQLYQDSIKLEISSTSQLDTMGIFRTRDKIIKLSTPCQPALELLSGIEEYKMLLNRVLQNILFWIFCQVCKKFSVWQMFNRQLSYFVNRLLTWNNFCEHSIFILLNKSTIKIVLKLPFPSFDEPISLKSGKI